MFVPQQVGLAFAVAEDDLVAVVTAARAGDRVAFAELYRRFHRAVHGVVLARVALGDAADLVQDVFAIALERLPELAEPPAFASWIMAIGERELALMPKLGIEYYQVFPIKKF